MKMLLPFLLATTDLIPTPELSWLDALFVKIVEFDIILALITGFILIPIALCVTIWRS